MDGKIFVSQASLAFLDKVLYILHHVCPEVSLLDAREG